MPRGSRQLFRALTVLGGGCGWGGQDPHSLPFSRSVKLNEHFVNTTDFLDAIKNNLDKALGKK